MIITTLVYIYGFILLLSSIFTFFLYLSYKENLLKLLLYFWLSGLVSFVLQGQLNSVDAVGFLAFSTNSISIYFLLRIYYALSDSILPIKLYSTIFALGLLSSVLSFFFQFDFAISASFFSFGVFLIILKAIFENTKKNSNPLNKGLSLLLFLNVLHFCDYPFTRTNPELAVYGFSIALGFYFIYSIYIPLFIIKKTSDNYSISLEKQVLARTIEIDKANVLLSLSNSELLSSNKNLGEVTKENQLLLSILVHDISNPLQVIISVVEKIADDKIAKLPTNITSRAQNALNTILDTLTTVRNYHAAKLGKLNPNLKRFDLTEAVKSVIDQFENKLNIKKIKVELIIQEGINTFINSDMGWVKNQILSNIFSNAIKFSFVSDPIKIEILSGNNGLFVKIRDYGPGIPNDLRANLFSSSTSTSTLGTLGEKGTGLGMPIVSEYLGRLKGSIEISDLAPDERGTCFEIYLPYDQSKTENKVAS